MSKKANPALIGGFVLGALALAVGGILVFGSGTLFQPRRPVVMYFNESVQGLDVGAPIVLSGVTIGSVTDIDLVVDPATATPRVLVRGQFLPETVSLEGADARTFWEEDAHGELLGRRLIEKGMRAQLGITSLITGKLAVNLVFRPDTEIDLVEAGPDFRTPQGAGEIPTVQSDLAAVRDVIERVMNKVAELPLEETLRDFSGFLSGAERLINKPELSASIDETKALLTDLRALVNNVDAKAAPLLDKASIAVTDIADAAESARQLMDRAEPLENQLAAAVRRLESVLEDADVLMQTATRVISPGKPLHEELIVTIRDVGSAARSLRALADTLEQNPNSILFGRSR